MRDKVYFAVSTFLQDQHKVINFDTNQINTIIMYNDNRLDKLIGFSEINRLLKFDDCYIVVCECNRQFSHLYNIIEVYPPEKVKLLQLLI